MWTKDEREAATHFRERYGAVGTEADAEFERRVLGSQYGANGYTTVRQADLLARVLRLREDDSLLDVGAGRGWPGLYLAAKTGCRVVVTDLPLEAMAIARRRGQRDLPGRSGAVAASAGSLPFRSLSFDAVVHTDVLC